MRFRAIYSLLAAAILPATLALSPTDFTRDGDAPQSGYSDNHNFDPAQLSQYKLSWRTTFNKAEFFYAKPLVYTPVSAPHERVYVVSNQNIVRILDGFTGAVLKQRTLDPPFASSDSDCGDIANLIGIIGTPIIDPDADIMYFWSKGYINQQPGPQGVAYGNWKLYAVSTLDLSDAPGFPVSIQGMNANNDRARYIIGGTLNQRPGLTMLGNTIVTGFGSHCDNFNFTGFLITASKTPGVGITNIQAMVAAPGAPVPQALDLMSQTNGKSGIWQAGFGLALDAPKNRIFFATGNGQSPGELGGDPGAPRSGKTYLSTLENTVASYIVDPSSGLLTQADWFCPTNYDHLNGADRDIGSSGVALLDGTTFSGGGVNRIAIAAGKNGTIFIMDADNLGGFKNGPSQTDGVLQIISPPGASFFSGVASYPLEGGYIYFVPTNDGIYAYKFGLQNGRPWFTLAGKTQMVFAGKGAPRVTSLNGQPGTGVVWISDVNQGVVAFKAIPDANGILEQFPIPSTGRLNKFHRPSFGNGRVYTAEENQILAVAGPVPPPIPSSSSGLSSATASPPSSSAASIGSTSTIPSTASSVGSNISPVASSSTALSTAPTTVSSAVSTTSLVASSSTASSTVSSAVSTTSLGASSSTASSTPSSVLSTTSLVASSSTSSVASTSSSSSSLITASSSSVISVPATTSSTTSTSTTSTSTTSTSTPPPYATPAPPSGIRTTLNWNLTWVNAAPDGLMRPMIGVNGQWPPPAIVLNYGDILVLNVNNNLGNQSTSIHFHGIFQRNTTFEDGPTFVSQCPIPPGAPFVYQFTATQVGTYWYHGHHGGQYIDGLRGPLIIKNPAAPYGAVDQDVTITLADHYHQQAPYLINYYQSVANTNNNGGTEPVPDSNLINGAQNVQFPMVPGKTNLFRIINMGAIAGQYIQFDGHTMTVVEVDGVYVQPYVVQQLFVAVAQRYAVIVKSLATNGQNYAIVATMDAAMFGENQSPANPSVSAWLVYDSSKSLPAPFTLQAQPWDDTAMVPLDQQPLLDPPAQTLYFAADFGPDENGITRGFLNGVTYVNQIVPTLYSVLSAPAQYVNNPVIYGTGSNPYILPYGSIIELQITNHDDRGHPFHLHGHNFQVVSRSDNGNLWPGLGSTPAIPMRRDTLVVYPQGTATIRFKSDNPGVQLFHCHTEWHVVSGMIATFIEAPTQLVAQKPYIPVSHRDVCDKHGIARSGNAAGNKNNWLNLTGANTAAPTDNWGAMVNPPSK